MEATALTERWRRLQRLWQMASRQEESLRREVQQLLRRANSLQQECDRLPWPHAHLRVVSAAHCCTEENYRQFLRHKQEMLRHQLREAQEELAQMRAHWQKGAQTVRILQRLLGRLEAAQQKNQQRQQQEFLDALVLHKNNPAH